MTFAGYSLGAVLGVFGAAAAAAVVLYILKLRRRRVPVVFAPIWQRVLGDHEASRLFSQLKRWLSLLLQLALLALLAFALGDPRFAGLSGEARHVVVLVDASASMSASDVSPSRIDAARAAVSRLRGGLGPNDRMLIAQMDATITPLSTMSDDASELARALERLEPSDTRAELGSALEFALDSLRGRSRPEIIVVSDGAFPAGAAERAPALGGVLCTFLPIGSSAANVALTAFSVRRYPLDRSRYEVMLEVMNGNDTPVDVELSMLGDGQIVQTARLSLAPNERRAQFYPNLAGASRTLEARLSADPAHDQLGRDNHGYALMPERRRTRVLVITPGNTYLEAALLLDEYLEVTPIAPGAAVPDGRYDVTLLDGVAAPAVADPSVLGGLLYLNPPAEGGPVRRRAAISDFGFDRWDEKSGILRWTAPENIQVAKGFALTPEPGDQVVGQSDLGPILISGRRANRPFVALGFDPRDSDLVLRVAWPLFVLNSINHFVEEESGYISSYRTGVAWRLPAPLHAERGVIRQPDGSRHPVAVRAGEVVYAGMLAGFYELSFEGSAEPPLEFAANLSDPEESQIKPQPDFALGGAKLAEPSGFQAHARQQIWAYLVLAVVLVSLLEWVTYHRRVTV